MIEYIRYKKSTGVITQTGLYLEDKIQLLEDDIHGVLIGSADDSVHYISNGEIKKYPERPSLDHEWNGSEWVDFRDESEKIDQIISRIRGRRNRLLIESDWTQLPDAPVNQQAWAEYRQALRDITNQGNLGADAVKWPQPPED